MAAQHEEIPTFQNFITTHTDDGQSVFNDPADASAVTWKSVPGTNTYFADMHLSPTVPANLTPSASNHDLAATEDHTKNNDKIAGIPAQGAAFRRTDIPPGGSSPMHRTLSVDYGVVISGTVELTLESGEKRVLRVGDTVVQRATMHRWRNVSDTEWARMVWTMLPIEKLEVNGEVLAEEFRIPGKH